MKFVERGKGRRIKCFFFKLSNINILYNVFRALTASELKIKVIITSVRNNDPAMVILENVYNIIVAGS
jgi:hypothetical protein